LHDLATAPMLNAQLCWQEPQNAAMITYHTQPRPNEPPIVHQFDYTNDEANVAFGDHHHHTISYSSSFGGDAGRRLLVTGKDDEDGHGVEDEEL
jgi:hypothetical protein